MTYKKDDYRPLLLAMEAIGWLHMAGKSTEEFLRNPDVYKTVLGMDWESLFRWVWYRYNDGCNIKEIKDFFEKHADMNGSGLLGILQAAHAMASGVEKNVPRETSKYLAQDASDMWLSSAFGHPERNLLGNGRPDVLKDTDCLKCRIKELLEELNTLAATTRSVSKWWDWRERAVGPEGWIRRHFTQTVAETRLPNNDVTLFDQSYMAAALFKSGVAAALVAEASGGKWPWDNKDPNDNNKEINIKTKLKWSVLGVGINSSYYESRAVRIGDWIGIRDGALRELRDHIRRVVEVDWAIGSLIYEDDDILMFTFPADKPVEGMDNLDIKEGLKSIVREIQTTIENRARDLHLEIKPVIRRAGWSSRSLVKMIGEMKEVRDESAVPFFFTPSSAHKSKRVCPVCKVRSPEGDGLNAVCEVCFYRRRERRLDRWLSGDYDTVWFDEVSDANRRLALVTMSLDILPWMEGDRIDSLRAQAIYDFFENNKKKLVDEAVDTSAFLGDFEKRWIGILTDVSKRKILDQIPECVKGIERKALDGELQKQIDRIGNIKQVKENNRVNIIKGFIDWIEKNGAPNSTVQDLYRLVGNYIDDAKLEQNAKNTLAPIVSSIRKLLSNPYYQKFFNYVKELLEADIVEHGDVPIFEYIQDGYGKQDWKNFVNNVIEDRVPHGEDTKLSWDDLDDNEKRARWLTHQLFRKLPSPGRIYRFQRQTRQFFEDLEDNIKKRLKEKYGLWRGRRIELEVLDGSKYKFKDRYLYYILSNGQRLYFVYKDEKFVSIANMERVTRQYVGKKSDDLSEEELQDILFNKSKAEIKFILEDENKDLVKEKLDDKRAKSEETVELNDVRLKIREDDYAPFIQLNLSPERFRVIVPLDAVPEIVKTAEEKWEEKFGRVWNRMPLRIGIVGFSEHMPLQAVMELTRDMEERLSERGKKDEGWTVQHSRYRYPYGVVELRLSPADGSHASEEMWVPVTLPGEEPFPASFPQHLPAGRRWDVFYPYVVVKNSPVKYPHDFMHPDGRVFRHVMDLRTGDEICVAPSLVAQAYMSSTKARFEPYRMRYLSEWRRMEEVWEILERRAPSQTAIRQFWEEMRQWKFQWTDEQGEWLGGGQEEWLSLVRSAAAQILGIKESEKLDRLEDAARQGTLEWALEWHLTVLKKHTDKKDN